MSKIHETTYIRCAVAVIAPRLPSEPHKAQRVLDLVAAIACNDGRLPFAAPPVDESERLARKVAHDVYRKLPKLPARVRERSYERR